MKLSLPTVQHFIRVIYIALLIAFSTANPAYAKYPAVEYDPDKLLNPELVGKFYALNYHKVHWYTAAPASVAIRLHFLEMLDSCMYIGLTAEKYHYNEITHYRTSADSIELMHHDRIFTDAIITYCKDVYQGADISKWISNDEISSKYLAIDDAYILNKLVNINTVADLAAFAGSIEPKQKEYLLLKKELNTQLQAKSNHALPQLANALNLFRWIHHFHFDKCVVVNIPAASLRYYEQNEMVQQMKVVVGKPSTKSPRFATWCYEVVLYPYWNVPRSIAVKELFPRFKKDPSLIESMNMEVIGSNGKAIDHTHINWARYTRNTFPYSFRQCTGCDNSLGVIKFNLTDPFSVYLHDTNYKLAFLSDTRFLSHGCIRVEKPIDLGNHILDNKLDSNFLKACIKGQKPVFISLEKRVPVFVIYSPAEPVGDSIVYHKDIYRIYQGIR